MKRLWLLLLGGYRANHLIIIFCSVLDWLEAAGRTRQRPDDRS